MKIKHLIIIILNHVMCLINYTASKATIRYNRAKQLLKACLDDDRNY